MDLLDAPLIAVLAFLLAYMLFPEQVTPEIRFFGLCCIPPVALFWFLSRMIEDWLITDREDQDPPF